MENLQSQKQSTSSFLKYSKRSRFFLHLGLALTVLVIVIEGFYWLKLNKEEKSLIQKESWQKEFLGFSQEQYQLQRSLLLATRQFDSENQLDKEILDKVKKEAIVAEEARKRKIIVSEEEIEENIALRIAEVGGEEEFLNFLTSVGLTYETVKEETRKILFEEKLRDEMEGYVDVQGFLFFFNDQREQEIAEQAGNSIFNVYKQEGFERAKAELNFPDHNEAFELVAIYDGRYPLRSPEQYPVVEIYQTLLSLSVGEVIKTQTEKFVFVGMAIGRGSSGGGINFEDWLEEEKKGMVMKTLKNLVRNLMGELVPVVEAFSCATGDCVDILSYYCDEPRILCTDNRNLCPADRTGFCYTPGSVRVTVRNVITGAYVSGASVTVVVNGAICNPSGSCATGSGGSCTVNRLNCCGTEGSYTISVSASNYYEKIQTFFGSNWNGSIVSHDIYLTPIQTITPTPVPGCDCTSWVMRDCGGGFCNSIERQYTRTCTPPGCADEEKCEFDPNCDGNGNGEICEVKNIMNPEWHKDYFPVYPVLNYEPKRAIWENSRNNECGGNCCSSHDRSFLFCVLKKDAEGYHTSHCSDTGTTDNRYSEHVAYYKNIGVDEIFRNDGSGLTGRYCPPSGPSLYYWDVPPTYVNPRHSDQSRPTFQVGGTYKFCVKDRNCRPEGSQFLLTSKNWECSDEVTITSSSFLPCPTSLNAVCNANGTATFSWTAVTGAVSYTLRANKDPYNVWSPVLAPSDGTDDFAAGPTTNTFTNPLARGVNWQWSIHPVKEGEVYSPWQPNVCYADILNCPPPKECSISIPRNTFTQGEDIPFTFSGDNNRGGSENVRLSMKRQDTFQIPGFTDYEGVFNPDWCPFGGDGVNEYFDYTIDHCTTTDGAPCSKTKTISDLPLGKYTAHCDLAASPGKCSGSFTCDYKGCNPAVDCKCYDCTAAGWTSCDPVNGRDMVTFEVVCENTYPSVANLLQPPNGFSFKMNEVALSWQGISGDDWGINCAGNNNKYFLYVDRVGKDDACPANFNNLVSGADITRTINDGSPTQVLLSNLSWNSKYCWGVRTSNGALSADSSIWSFTVLSPDPWYQTQGGNVYGQTVSSPISENTLTGRYFSLNGSWGKSGFVSAQTHLPGPANFNNAGISQTDTSWQAQGNLSSVSNRYNYQYFASLLDIDPANTEVFRHTTGGDLGLPPLEKDIAVYSGSNMKINSDWNVGGRKIIAFVNGPLRINERIKIDPGGFLAVIVKGNLVIDVGTGASSTTPLVQGVYVVDGSITTVKRDAEPKFIGEGIFFSGNGFVLNKDLVGNNLSYPAEVFIFNPRYLFAAPKSLRSWSYFWQEVAP